VRTNNVIPLIRHLILKTEPQQRRPYLPSNCIDHSLQKARRGDRSLRRFCKTVSRSPHAGFHALSARTTDHGWQASNTLAASTSIFHVVGPGVSLIHFCAPQRSCYGICETSSGPVMTLDFAVSRVRQGHKQVFWRCLMAITTRCTIIFTLTPLGASNYGRLRNSIGWSQRCRAFRMPTRSHRRHTHARSMLMYSRPWLHSVRQPTKSPLTYASLLVSR
jgi:hypothetical protein